MHLTSPTGERLVLESREDPDVKTGDMVGMRFGPAHVMDFDAKTEARLRQGPARRNSLRRRNYAR